MFFVNPDKKQILMIDCNWLFNWMVKYMCTRPFNSTEGVFFPQFGVAVMGQ